MYNLSFLEKMANAELKKRAVAAIPVSTFRRIADTVGFAANAKILSDMTNRSLAASMVGKKDQVDEEDQDLVMGANDLTVTSPKKVSVLLTGDLNNKLSPAQKKKLISVARKISADRKAAELESKK